MCVSVCGGRGRGWRGTSASVGSMVVASDRSDRSGKSRMEWARICIVGSMGGSAVCGVYVVKQEERRECREVGGEERRVIGARRGEGASSAAVAIFRHIF